MKTVCTSMEWKGHLHTLSDQVNPESRSRPMDLRATSMSTDHTAQCPDAKDPKFWNLLLAASHVANDIRTVIKVGAADCLVFQLKT